MKTAKETDERLTTAFRLVMVRKPSAFDLKTLRNAFEKQKSAYAKDAAAAKALLAVGESKRDETLDPTEHAALSAVCLAILNLDEALTRE